MFAMWENLRRGWNGMGIQSFAKCLRQIVAARNWSLDALAEITGYKSRTSVARAFCRNKEQSEKQERFFERLERTACFSPQEESRLRAALDKSVLSAWTEPRRGAFPAI